MKEKTYRLSLTGVQFALNETLLIANEFSKNNDWDETQKSVVENYLLGSNNRNSNVRKFREIKLRLQNLTQEELNLLIQGSTEDQKAMTYLAICKSYPILQQYVVEIIRQKILRFDYMLFDSDYSLYYQDKAEIYEKLQTLKESTQNKIKRVVHKILFDVNILVEGKEGHTIVPPILTDKIKNVIKQDSREWLKCFLLPDGEI